MATEQYIAPRVLQSQPSSGGFDCNICLDTVRDPVVTLCGHLYCWPCIYQWITQQINSPEAPTHQEPRCPVCKTDVSERTLIPLYGRGQSMTGSGPKAKDFGSVIPNRPKGPPCHEHQDLHRPSDYMYNDHTYEPTISLAGTTTFHPVISMFGEMICSRFFGNTESFYTYPDSYNMVDMSSRRARRRVLQADRSLSRLCFFLCCCLVLCLVLF